MLIPKVYCSNEEVGEALLKLGEKFNIVLNIKNSGAYNVVWICKHSGAYRLWIEKKPLRKGSKKSEDWLWLLYQSKDEQIRPLVHQRMRW